MAAALMACSTSKLPSTKTPQIPKLPTLPQILKLTLLKTLAKSSFLIITITAAVSPLPSIAADIEKAAHVNFNLTLSAIIVEFLLLMVTFNKLYFTPLENFMDKRDTKIRGKLGDLKDTSVEVKQLEEQAMAVMKVARVEIAAGLNKMKKVTLVELEAKTAEERNKVEVELVEALQSLEKQNGETIKALDDQISQLGNNIVKKVLPSCLAP